MVNYQVVKLVGKVLSDDFFAKFLEIRTVKATGTVDRAEFEWFLKNVNKSDELILIEISLDLAFLENLPNINRRLTKLEMRETVSLITNFAC